MDKKDFFEQGIKIYSASSPGRMDIMGGIADYSGSLLLQMPLKQKTSVTIQNRTDSLLKVFSTTEGDGDVIMLDLHNLVKIDQPKQLREAVFESTNQNWVLYVLGCFILLVEKKLIPVSGANVYIESDVPIGKGLSSSAALELATLRALQNCFEFKMDKMELAMLAQKVENQIVGAPCGLMDQLASTFGKEGHLLPIICQPAQIYDPIPIPNNMHFAGIDSGVRHAVTGHSYAEVRAAAFMGYTIIALAAGVTTELLSAATENEDWSELPFEGYLANIPVELFEKDFLHLLPNQINGQDFLKKFKVSIDQQTKIDFNTTYHVKAAAQHPIYENERVHAFQRNLMELNKKKDLQEHLLRQLGRLMYSSHDSYSACGLGHSTTDKLVDLVKSAGDHSGIYGAKITGGGSGGTVCILAFGSRGLESAKKIWKQFEKDMNKQLFFYGG